MSALLALDTFQILWYLYSSFEHGRRSGVLIAEFDC